MSDAIEIGCARNYGPVILRDATRNDLDQFYGGSIPGTMRALAAVAGERVIGLVGIRYQGPDQPPYLFSELPEAVRAGNGRAILRAARAALRRLAWGPTLARTSPDLAGAGRFLTHIGFEHIGDDIYRFTPQGGR